MYSERYNFNLSRGEILNNTWKDRSYSCTPVGGPQWIFFPPVFFTETCFMDWMSENIFTEIILWLTVAMCKTAIRLVHA